MINSRPPKHLDLSWEPMDRYEIDPNLAHVSGQLGLPGALRPYQWEGVSFLFRAVSALLADEMGLGKTVQVAVALSLLLREPGLNRALIVVPASLITNWQRELARWAPSLVIRRLSGDEIDRIAFYNLPIQVLIASYEQIRADAFERIPQGTFDIVILDEAQRTKNRASRTALACRLLPRARSWALTATPLENTRDELESVFAFLAPGLIEPADNKLEIFRKISPHFLRRKKRDVLADLPPIIWQDMLLDLGEDQRQTYDALWNSRFDSFASQKRPVAAAFLLGLITRLKQICNFDPHSNSSSKLDALSTLIDSMNDVGDKGVIFSQYVETLKWLSDRIGGFTHDIYHGELTLRQRDEIVDRFENEPGPRLLLVSLRAGGLGLNLNSASMVVLFDRWWNPAVEVQAIHRAHRFDRKMPLHVVRFLVADTIEEQINTILEDKQRLFEEYVEKAPGGEIPGLTRAELMHILDLQPSEVN